jgi:hypothetical protein
VLKSGKHISKRRGFIDNDPLPDRPPEDDVASCLAYFELLVSYAHHMPKDLKAVTDRVERLLDPANWAMIMNTFAVRGVVAPPEVVGIIERKIAADPAALSLLGGHYLCALAYGLGASKASGDAAFAAVGARAAALGKLHESDLANLKLGFEAAGKALPEGLVAVPDPQLDLDEPAAPVTPGTAATTP